VWKKGANVAKAAFFLYNPFMLTKEEVEKIAVLARIELTENEVEKFQKDLSAVLDYVEELKEVNVEGLEEVSQVTGLVNVQRMDVVVDHGNREEIFSQAPEMKDGYFKVKAILN
jgi:aspartyl-tRNA(Asn)/glutamyl-tRNA(Gln) amidotransferase subunit C